MNSNLRSEVTVVYDAKTGLPGISVPTGRGSWVNIERRSLEELLEQYDAAWPRFTDEPRDVVIDAYRHGQQMLASLRAAGGGH